MIAKKPTVDIYVQVQKTVSVTDIGFFNYSRLCSAEDSIIV